MKDKINMGKHFKVSELIDKLKQDKKALIIVLTGFVGMILICFSGSGSNSNAQINSATETKCVYDAVSVKNELTELIENINGAGKTMVMITYKSDIETVYATDTEELIRNDETKVVNEYVIIEKDSDESGMAVKNIYPEVQGIAVICEGGDNQLVREKIFSLVCALFGVSSNCVSVSAMA